MIFNWQRDSKIGVTFFQSFDYIHPKKRDYASTTSCTQCFLQTESVAPPVTLDTFDKLFKWKMLACLKLVHLSASLLIISWTPQNDVLKCSDFVWKFTIFEFNSIALDYIVHSAYNHKSKSAQNPPQLIDIGCFDLSGFWKVNDLCIRND